MKIYFNNQQASFKAHRPLGSIGKLPPDKKAIINDFINAEQALTNSIAKNFNITYCYRRHDLPETISISASPIKERDPELMKKQIIKLNEITIQKLRKTIENLTGQKIETKEQLRSAELEMAEA